MKTTECDRRPEPLERDIQRTAYFLWQELGRPEGRDVETWFAARERLRHRPVLSDRIPARPPGRSRTLSA